MKSILLSEHDECFPHTFVALTSNLVAGALINFIKTFVNSTCFPFLCI